MGTPRAPRTPRGDNDNGSISLEVEVERTIGSVGGIRTDASATVGIDAFLRNNRATGYIDPANRSGGLSTGIGSSRRGLGGEVGIDAQFNEDGSVNSIGGNIGGSVIGFGGNIGGSSAGDAKVGIQGFGIGVEIARDKDGSITLQTCFGIGIIEACTTFSRDRGDPQNTEGTIRGPVINFGAGNKPPRNSTPNANRTSPNDTNRRDARKKPQPKPDKPDKPKPNPRPQPDKPDKPKTDKKPQLDTRKKPVGFGKKPVVTPPKKRPLEPTKKPTIDLKKKPTIDLKKKPVIDLKKKPTIDLKKKPVIDPSPINLKKPVPAPLVPKLPKPSPSPSPTTPKLPRPAPSPLPSPSPKPPRPTPSPIVEPYPPNSDGSYPVDKLPPIDPTCYYHVHVIGSQDATEYIECLGWFGGFSQQGLKFKSNKKINKGAQVKFGPRVPGWSRTTWWYMPEPSPPTLYRGVEIWPGGGLASVIEGDMSEDHYWGKGPKIGENVTVRGPSSGFATRVDFPIPATAVAAFISNGIAAMGAGWHSFIVKQDITYCLPWTNPPRQTSNPTTSPKYKKPRLPNKPTKIKPMDCCKEIKDIYKYLGIAKMKKDKFKVAKAFMVAGGQGNQECEDYYQVTQALFKMLANGLIINPISKPLGNDWQVVNATAWATQMYEMAAESMSDGNSSQKFEIAAIMQMAQLMSTLAETTRKVEYIIDAIGYEPILNSEEVPISFTIYEGHKGFGKKEPQKIDISKPKTDNEVETVLTKMLMPSKIPIVSWQFNPNNISISKALRAL